MSPFSREYRAVTAGIVALVTLIAFEALAVSTAMPVVAADLGGLRSFGLAFSLFLTMTLLGTVLAGGWSDARGPRGPILAGLVLFAGGLVVCGTAQTFGTLLVGRVVSGVGGGLLVVSMYVVIARVFPETLRPRLFGYISAAWVLPSVLGPPVAGWVAQELTWRLVFLAVPPLVLVALLGILSRLRHLGSGSWDDAPPPRPPTAGRARTRALLGIGLAGGATLVQWGGQDLASPTPITVAALVSGLLLVALTLPRLLPRGALRAARGLPSVVAVRGLFTAAFFGAETYVPLMLISERGLSPALAGLALTGGALGWAAGSYLQGRPGLRVPRSTLLSGGALLVAASVSALIAGLDPAVTPWVILPAWTVGGLGMGLGMSSTSVLTLQLSPEAVQGRNSASLQLSDALGGVAGITAAQAVYAGMHAPPASDAPAFTIIWAGLAVVALLGAVVGARARDRSVAQESLDTSTAGLR